MTTLAHIELLMNELGPILDPLQIEGAPEQRCWSVLLDEDLALLIDFDEEQGKLVISGDLGQPASGDRTPLYEILLTYNAQWALTGGCRMALDEPNGSVIQIFDLHAEGLDVSRLSHTLTTFGDVARTWRDIVQGAAPAPAMQGSSVTASMVQV